MSRVLAAAAAPAPKAAAKNSFVTNRVASAQSRAVETASYLTSSSVPNIVSAPTSVFAAIMSLYIFVLQCTAVNVTHSVFN